MIVRAVNTEISGLKVCHFRTCPKLINSTSGFTILTQITRDVTTHHLRAGNNGEQERFLISFGRTCRLKCHP
jgi:hypothetical protein